MMEGSLLYEEYRPKATVEKKSEVRYMMPGITSTSLVYPSNRKIEGKVSAVHVSFGGSFAACSDSKSHEQRKNL